jgi:hypothetical protein
VLFAGRPLAYERTSGTAAGAKLIPYSAAGLADFRQALLPWLVEGARVHGVTGSVYLSISPATRPSERIGEVPVGLADGAYLGAEAGRIIAELSAVPFDVALIADVDRWRDATLRHLARAGDLELISCWSPTFLLRLLDDLGDPTVLWPRLKVVSTWASAASRPFAAELASRLPQAKLQPKGLMSTECVVTVPDSRGRPVLTARGFFEFLRDGHLVLAHELERGAVYEVVATTASGLYRYRTGDLVRCEEARADGRPVLDFLGRGTHTSDLVGEKLTEAFAQACLEDVPGFRLLTPTAAGDGYVLAIERGRVTNVERVERRLCGNPQYAHARRLGQLQALRLLEVEHLFDRHVAAQLACGARLGAIKPTPLCRERSWLKRIGVPA